MSGTPEFGEFFTKEDDSTPARRTIVRYNFAAPFLFAVGVLVAIVATSAHLLALPALGVAFVAAAILALVGLGIYKDGVLASTGAVVATTIGLLLLYVTRHSVIHLLIPAIFWVVLFVLAYLVGIHVYRVRR